MDGNATPGKGKLVVVTPTPTPTLLKKPARAGTLKPLRPEVSRHLARSSAQPRRFERPVIRTESRPRGPVPRRPQLPSALGSLRLQLELEAMREHSRH